LQIQIQTITIKHRNVNLASPHNGLKHYPFGIRHKILHLPVNLALTAAMAQLLNRVVS